MTRITLVVVLGTLGIVGGASAASESAATRAQLQMMDMQPLTVRGAGFVAGERVSVLARASGGMYAKSKVANAAGVFTVKFQVTLGACRGYYSLRAFGSRGSTAHALARFPQRGCADVGTGR